jgi:hypothetical protein
MMHYSIIINIKKDHLIGMNWEKKLFSVEKRFFLRLPQGTGQNRDLE